MRLLFILIFFAGAAAGIAYPWVVQNFSGHELGTWRVFDGAGFKPVDIVLTAEEAPLRILLDLTSSAPPSATGSETVLTLTVSTGGKTILAETLNFVDASVNRDSPQPNPQTYRDDAGVIRDVIKGSYRFTVGQGDADGIPIRTVDLILRAGALEHDSRVQPIGFMVMAVGFIGFALTLRRGERGGGGQGGAKGEPQPPIAPRWGRGEHTSPPPSSLTDPDELP
jgi:hypothetical protein